MTNFLIIKHENCGLLFLLDDDCIKVLTNQFLVLLDKKLKFFSIRNFFSKKLNCKSGKNTRN